MPRIETAVGDELDAWVRDEAKRRSCSKGEVLKIALEALRDGSGAAPDGVRDARDASGDDVATILATLDLFIPRYIADHPQPSLTEDERQTVNRRWETFRARREGELKARRPLKAHQ